MSSRKSSVTIVAKFDSIPAIKDKDTTTDTSDVNVNININDNISDGIEKATSISTNSPSKNDADSPTQKTNNSSNNRVTRNSPLLFISPNSKKEQTSIDSEHANSESEDNSSTSGSTTKKLIRGRKSIKQVAKESPTKDAIEGVIEDLLSKDEDTCKELTEQLEIETPAPDIEENEQETENLSECECDDYVYGFEQTNAEENVVESECKEKDAKDLKENKDKEIKETKLKDIIDKNSKDPKDVKDVKDNKESKDSNENKDSKDLKELKELKDVKDIKESKDAKGTDAKDIKESVTVINRMTRNAAAQEVASNTRITRNRQSSATATTRPETPPVAARRGRPSNTARTLSNQKRKRSIEEASDASASKVIKTEPKDVEDEETIESNAAASSCGNIDLEAVKIKQEQIESDDASSTTAENVAVVSNATVTANATATATTGRGRGGRWAGRKPTQTASPSTRSTRQSKVASPASSISSTSSTAPEPKRRRTGGSTVRRSASTSLLKTSSQISVANSAPDEDSKDSMASFLDDIMQQDVKMEKLTPDLDDNNEIDVESKKSMEQDDKLEENSTQACNGIGEPLSIETDVATTPVVEEEDATISSSPDVCSAVSTVAEDTTKDASLSPELISEGVSEISVKQFYKRPQFLENNRGIEEDPKLGEIVQKVTTEMDTTTSTEKEAEPKHSKAEDVAENISSDAAVIEETVPLDESVSAELIKEGELVYEESNDGGKKTPSNDTESSLINVSSVTEDIASSTESTEQSNIEKLELKDEEEESFQGRLVMDEDDVDDDDMTAEESETISMDNNASIHDGAADEDEEVHDDGTESQSNNNFKEIDELAQEGGLIKETKQTTSNECDIQQAKLQKDHKVDEIDAEEQKENEKKNEKSKDGKNAKNVAAEKCKDENVKKEKDVLKKSNTRIERKTSIEEKKTDSKKMKKVGKVNAVEKVAEVAVLEIKDEKSVLKTTKVEDQHDEVEPMEVDESKPEKDEELKIKLETKSKDENITEKITTSRPVTPKDASVDDDNTESHVSPNKSTNGKDEDANSVKSSHSTDATSWTTIEPDCDDEEKLRQKEQHLKNLGLLTLKAAEERRQEFIQTAAAVEATRVVATNHYHSKRNGNKTAAAQAANNNATTHEYTGTLKTVIKLNRTASGASSGQAATLTATSTASTSSGSGNSSSNGSNGSRKPQLSNAKDTNVRRQSLKITFQKGRGRGHQTINSNDRNSGTYSSTGNNADHNSNAEDSYYTIQNENEGVHKNGAGSLLSTATVAGTKDHNLQKQQHNNNNNNNNFNHNTHGHGRKSYNSRSNTTASHNNNIHNLTSNSSHIDSSHSEGQNDAHQNAASHGHGHSSIGISSHKKDDREEILIPEKASSFKFHPGRLCEDQCYYCSGKFGLYDTPCHVGQIKSVERQQKILKNEEKLTVDNCLCDACFRHVDRRANVPSYKKRLSAPGHLENAGSGGTDGSNEDGNSAAADDGAVDETRKCVVPECEQSASHSLRRKCIRKSVKKFLLNFDMPAGSPFIWLCQSHYDAVVQCSGCVLCKRRLGKNHMYHITSDTERLEKALTDMGIPVQLGIGTAVCKLCRYFANLLMKPPDSSKSQKAEFVKNYRKRLLQFHNIHDISNDVSEADEEESNDGTAAATSKATNNKSTAQSRRQLGKDQANTASPDASSGSSIICLNENANDAASGSSNSVEPSQQDTEILMDYAEEDTSNENSKSSSSGAVANETNKQSSRLKAILQSGGKNKSAANTDIPSALLRSNPNLSMRELFPGEEDLGLQFKAPFGSSNSQRTPEGWTRVQTFLQYDDPTRRLWEELQKPYGNQSSFLRHLILLEKYYRNGDLVLSPNASSNACVYTQTVRQRLSSYDQGHCGGLDVPLFQTQSEGTTTESAEEIPKDKEIPLVEIKDDEEESVERGNETPKSSENEDVTMQTSTKSGEKISSKRRPRSVSVDKLTKQLSSNAVTIIARSKETSVSGGKAAAGDTAVQKRNESPKQSTIGTATTAVNNISLSNTNSSPIASLAPLSATTSDGGTNIPGGIASSSANSRSILKSNLLGMTGGGNNNSKSVEILPIALQKQNLNTVSATTVNVPVSLNDSNHSSNSIGTSSKQQKILEVANKLLGSQMEAAAAAAAIGTKPQHSSLLTSPPELVSLQRRSGSGSGNTANTSSSSSSAATSASSSSGTTTNSLINAKRAQLMQSRQAAKPPPNVVILPDSLSSHERAESKSWRPTLMSVEENQHLLNKNGPLYQTADGRRLPGLVQVQSGGKPFLISIFDYNRMCILRREKLLRDQMLKAGKHNKSQQQHQHQHQHQRAAQQNSNFHKMNSSGGGGGGGGNVNSNSNNNGNNNNSGIGNAASKQAQAAAAQQQLIQLMQFQKQHQQATMKAAAAAANSGNNRYAPIAPKPSLMSAAANSMSSNRHLPNQPNFQMPLLANALSNAAAAAAANSGAATLAASLDNTPWLWNNFPDAQELLRNGAGGSKLPPLMPKPTTSASATITSKQLQQQHQQHQQLLMDNNLMSKIPKSLTVIPQHKLMGNTNNSACKE